jgi:hypothetical protein
MAGMGIQPPFYDDIGPAPTGVCSRLMGASPCGAAGTHHVIWDMEMTNGCVCPKHVAEARMNWVFVGLHPYTAACAARRATWLPDEDRCVMLADPEREAASAAELSR